MKFYVAGKWEERRLVKFLQAALIELGHEITKDWTVDEEFEPGYPIINVVEDVRGAKTADAYVGIFKNTHNYKGALIEMGVSLGSRIPIYIIGHAIDSCIFTSHPLVRQFDNEEQFIAYIDGVNGNDTS